MRALLHALVISWLALGIEARCAADVLTIRFETFGEPPPAKLCVISEFGSGTPLATAELETRLDATLAGLGRSADPMCKVDFPGLPAALAEERLHQDGAGESYRMLCNTSDASGGVLVLWISASSVTSVTLLQSTARIELHRPNRSKGPALVRTIGGNYVMQASIPTRIDMDTEAMSLPLVPKCVRRTVAIPTHECRQDEERRYVLEGATGEDPGNQPTMSVMVHNDARGRLAIERCGHEFSASWGTPVPPADLKLEVTRFWFEWKTNCLTPASECPDRPQLAGAGVQCDHVTRAQCSEVCRYECSGSAQFPARVEFSKQHASVTQSWTEPLTFPGLLLTGYMPPDQRRLAIVWGWKGDREARARKTGDRIDFIELRSPEGTLYRIRHDTRQVRMPELDCDDYVSYRYVGTRSFREELTRTSGGSATLRDPSELRTDQILGVAVGLGGGIRRIGDVGPAIGPQAELQLLLSLRQLRELAYFDLEARFGAILTDQPYCSHFLGEECSWKKVTYWRLPVTFGPNFYPRDPYTLGFGVGYAWGTNAWFSEARMASQAHQVALRLHAGYRINRIVTLEFFWRIFLREQVLETVFDRAGVVAHGVHHSASLWSSFFGFLLRSDDLF